MDIVVVAGVFGIDYLEFGFFICEILVRVWCY